MTRPKSSGRSLSRPLTIRVRAPLAVLFLLAVLLIRDELGVLRIGLCCAVLHEGGHLAAWAVLVREPARIEVSPLGLCLSMRGVWLSPARELMLAAAGPLANLLFSAAAAAVMEYAAGYSYAGCWFAAANLLVGGANLLPLPGLDGARMLGAAAALARRPAQKKRLHSCGK